MKEGAQVTSTSPVVVMAGTSPVLVMEFRIRAV
jgi:hypothetical protein